MKKIVISFIIILIAIVLVIILKPAEACDNLSNMGLAVEYKNAIYYNKYEKGIFVTQNGSEKQLTDETAYSINIINDKIYYITVEGFSDVVIKCVDIDGQNRTKLADINTSISKIYVDKNYMYYVSNSKESGLYRLDLSGQNPLCIKSGEIFDFCVSGNVIYYVDSNHNISKIEKNGENSAVINKDVLIDKIQVVGKWIYYYNKSENALFKLSKNGKENQLVSVLVKDETYNVCGEYVYYFDKENSQICRMNLKNTSQYKELKKLEINKTKINIAGKYIYYLDKSQNNEQTYQIYKMKLNGDDAGKIEY